MSSATAARETHGGVTRLVEAERRWQSALIDARERAARILADAETSAGARAHAAEGELVAAVEARRRELDASLPTHLAAAREELAVRTRQYTDASDAVVTRIASLVAARAPWFAAVPAAAPESP